MPFRHAKIAMLAAAALSTPAIGKEDVVRMETPSGQVIMVETVIDGLVNPWAIAQLPDGSWLITERGGALRLLRNGKLSEPISGTPRVDARGQGGLLDVALDPDFASNRLVYLSFSEPGEGGTNSTAVFRGRLNQEGTVLEEGAVIFSQVPKERSTKHFGSRLVFDDEGRLFVTTGERSDADIRVQAQELDSHIGKIIRINPDGSVPEDNPFIGKEGVLPEIYAYGVRNVQAAALQPDSGMLWEIEHGPRGGDEINVVEPGANYGWPLVSHGVNYNGTPVGTGKQTMEGVTDPVFTWTPVIAPSGMIFYNGEAFAEWEGDILVGGLAATSLVRVDVEGSQVREAERLLQDLGARIRDVAQDAEGAIYVVTDGGNARMLRITPGG